MTLVEGLIAAAHTPTLADGTLAVETISAQAALLRNADVSGVFVGGSTGECLSFTAAERIEAAEAWCSAARQQALLCVIHAGSPCQHEAVEIAQAANAADAGAVAAMAPSFIQAASIDDLCDYLIPIAKAAGDRPFLFYDNPGMTHVNFRPAKVIAVLKQRIPTFAGVKFTRADLEATESCLEACGESAQLLFGCDEMLLFALGLGVKAAVGSTYNHSAAPFRQMMFAHSEGDMVTATAAHDRVVVMIDLLLEHGVVRTGKAIMSLVGVDCGPPRPPLKPLDEAEFSQVTHALAALGLPDMSDR